MIEIRILEEKERRAELHRVCDDIQKNGVPDGVLILVTPEQFATIFSPERVRLLMLVAKRPGNISVVAELAHRPFEAVHRDLKLLASYNLISMRKTGREVIPTINGRISVPIVA